MPAEMSWTDNANVATTSLPWTTVQRTSVTSTIERRIWNELSVTGAASTATNVMIRPGYQMNVGEPFLFDSVEPAEGKWLRMRQLSTVSNPTNGTSSDYAGYSLGWTDVGASSVFVVRGAIPRRFARQLEMYLSAESTGSATSINAMQVTADWDRGLQQMPVFTHERVGDHTVFRGDGNQYRLIRAREGVGFQCKQNPAAPDLDTVYVEPAFFILGVSGMGETIPFLHTVPAVANDGAAAALLAGEEYLILVSKNTTGFRNGVTDFTFTKGLKAVAGSATAPAAPSVDDITLCLITKGFGANLTNAVIDNTLAVHDQASITFDGVGLDCVIGSFLQVCSGIAGVEGGERTQTGLANNSTLYAKLSPQKQLTVNTTAQAANENLIGKVTTSGGNTTAVSNRQAYDGRAAYRARRRREVGPWINPNASNVAQFFGRLDRSVSGAVDDAPLTAQTLTFMGGHRVLAHITNLTTPGVLRLTGTRIDGAGAETAATNEDLRIGYVNQVVMSDTRWFGTGANSPDVTLNSNSSLDAILTAYRCEPWDNRGAPFHLASVRCEFFPTTNAAELRVRLYKVTGRGATLLTTVFDSTLKAGLDGSGTGILQIPCQLVINTNGGVVCDTEQRGAVPDAAIVNPWSGEWIYAEVSDMVDIDAVRCTMDYYDLFEA